MANDYIGRYSGAKIDELLTKADTSVYTKSEIDPMISRKVDKETGMGLSEESFSAAEKQKLAGLENYDDSPVKAELAVLAKNSAKNHLKNPITTHTHSGITYDVQPDGTIIISGTAQTLVNPTFDTFELKPGHYIFSCLERSSFSTADSYLTSEGATLARDMDGSREFTLTETKTITFKIRVREGVTMDNVIARPMICDACVSDDSYVPFAYDNTDLTRLIESLTARVEALENA